MTKSENGMIPDKAKPMLAYITANPGLGVRAIAITHGMAIGTARERLVSLLACGAIHAPKLKGHGGITYHPGPAPAEDRTYRAAPVSSHCEGRPMRITLPPCPVRHSARRSQRNRPARQDGQDRAPGRSGRRAAPSHDHAGGKS